MIEQIALLIVAGDPAASGDGPSAAPSSPNSDSSWGYPSKYVIEWVNGDATAYTEIYENSITPANLLHTANPGITQWLSTITVGTSKLLYLRHYKNGQGSLTVAHTTGS